MPKLTSQIHQLEIPFEPDAEDVWKPCHIFHGSTSDNWVLNCHVSALRQGKSPHRPHRHPEEEILLVLSGEIDLILQDRPFSQGVKRHRLKRGQFVYYPAGYAHTLEALSEEPANYIMLKWSSYPIRKTPHMQFGIFSTTEGSSEVNKDTENGFRTHLMFEERTAYLRKLHCHTSILAPLSGYDTHVDHYDVVIIILEGEVMTLGEKLRSNGVIYYAAGEPHGMKNLGETTARYLVFEFHGIHAGFGDRCRIWIRSLLSRLNDPKDLIKGLMRFVRRLRS